MFENLIVTDNAAVAQQEVAEYLRALGYSVMLEYHISYDATDGRIDIVAKKDGHALAIEVDRSSPRKKSLVKLNLYKEQHKNCECYVLLRGYKQQYIQDGIKIIGIPKKRMVSYAKK